MKGVKVMDEPLIYTSKGNIPLASLEYSHAWEDTDTYTKFTETHTLEGEVVKQAVHIMMKTGQSATTTLEGI